jgi:perosamine synthetase
MNSAIAIMAEFLYHCFMNIKKYSVARPYIAAQEKRYIQEVLDSGVLSMGPKQERFEKEFAQKIGVKYACAVNSGTAGLHLAMIAAGIKEGDEVITSPFSFIASANCIIYAGAKPIFTDIDPATFNLNPSEIEKKITKKTKAILVVHIFGQAADMSPILKIAKKYKLKIIEDACESVCATYKGRKVGTFGESAVFAFYPNKQMTTGEGGMIVTNNKKVYELCNSFRNQGRTENMQWLDHKYLGYNYRMDEMSAALGLAQLERLDWMIGQRKKIAGWYDEILSSYPKLIQIPHVSSYNTHTRFVYVIVIANKKSSRDVVIRKLAEKGISAKPYLPSIHLFDFYRKRFLYKTGDFPVSERVSRHSLALPFYIGLKKSDIKYICQKLIEVL